MTKKVISFFLALTVLLFSITASAKEFSDIKKGSWYYDVVTDMTAQGLLAGCDDGSFQPTRDISFAEFVSITARCVGLENGIGQTNHWAADTMQAALEAGWYDWDECPPTGEKFNQPIQRQIALKILMKAFAPDVRGDWGLSGSINDFSSVDGRYYEPVLAAYSLDIVVGDERGNLMPQKGLWRAEACVIFSKTLILYPRGDIKPVEPTPTPVTPIKGGAKNNGWLKLDGTKLVNEKGKAVVLHGMSSHGIQWDDMVPFTSKAAIKTTADYGANLFRVAMYTAENGYISNPSTVKKRVIAAVEAAISLDMYVIIDWHILSDGNPNKYVNESMAFFKEISEKYKDKPNVIYEICNEPNGGTTWEDIYNYANKVIPVIRKNSPKSIIICGTPTWSQDVDLVAKKRLSYSNVMYAFHFYAGTHGDSYRAKVKTALKAGTPIFVSEWGTCDASGAGAVNSTETKKWLTLMTDNNLSWANWSLCTKNEAASALKSSASTKGGWKESDLSPSGKLVFTAF